MTRDAKDAAICYLYALFSALWFILLLCGCAETRIKTAGMDFRTPANAEEMELDAPGGLHFRVKKINHSTITNIWPRAIVKVAALGLPLATGGASTVTRTVTAIPAVVHSAGDFRNAPIELRP